MSKITTKAYFDAAIKAKIIEWLNYAQREIFIVASCFNDEDLFDTLVTLPVDIKLSVLVQKNGNNLDWEKLYRENIMIYELSEENSKDIFINNQFCVIDGFVTITGSYKWCQKENYTFDNIIIIRGDYELNRQCKKQFEFLVSRFCKLFTRKQGSLISPINIQNLLSLQTPKERQEWWNSLSEDFKTKLNFSYIQKRGSTESPDDAGIQNLLVLNHLDLRFAKRLQSLKGIEYFTNVTSLNVREACIDSLEYIRKMKKLESLICYNNLLSSLDGIQDLPNLKYIEIDKKFRTDKFPLEYKRVNNLGFKLTNPRNRDFLVLER